MLCAGFAGLLRSLLVFLQPLAMSTPLLAYDSRADRLQPTGHTCAKAVLLGRSLGSLCPGVHQVCHGEAAPAHEGHGQTPGLAHKP